MNIDSLPDYILYPSEDRDAFLHLATQLHDDYDPQCEDELQIFNEILVASWLRNRYETVRTALYKSKNGLAQNEPNSPPPNCGADFQPAAVTLAEQTAVSSDSQRQVRCSGTDPHPRTVPAGIPTCPSPRDSTDPHWH